MVKVLGALQRMADMLQQQSVSSNGTNDPPPSSSVLLADLSAYLTLDRAQKQYGFSAESFGITDERAAEIAVAFSKFDTSESSRRVCLMFT
jgi:hypothetical protein